MNKQFYAEENMKYLKESLMLAKVAIAYCEDEATPSEEVETLRSSLEMISKNLEKVLSSLQ